MRKITKMTRKSVTLALSMVLSLGVFGSLGFATEGFKDWGLFTGVETPDYEIEAKNMSVKMMTTTEGSDGRVTKIFTYTVTPDNASNQQVTISAKYQDGTNCDAVLTASANSTTKQITIVCLKDFSQKIQVVIKSVDNPNTQATITIDYVKKIAGMESLVQYGIVSEGEKPGLMIGGGTLSEDVIPGLKLKQIKDFKPEYFVRPIYSKYTKDKEYTFYTDRGTYFEANGKMTGVPQEVLTAIEQKVMADLSVLETNQATINFDADYIWNLSSDNTYHSALRKYASDVQNFNLCFDYNTVYYCHEDPEIIAGSDGRLYVFFNYDFSNSKYHVTFDGLKPETSYIEF